MIQGVGRPAGESWVSLWVASFLEGKDCPLKQASPPAGLFTTDVKGLQRLSAEAGLPGPREGGEGRTMGALSPLEVVGGLGPL